MAIRGHLAAIDDTSRGAVRIQKLGEWDAGMGAANVITVEKQEVGSQADVVFYQTGDEQTTLFWIGCKAQPETTYPELRFIGRKVTFTGGSVLEELRQQLKDWMQDQVEVYPGYSVSPMEYNRRFRGVDLNHFRKVMAPELFKTYVQTMGSIEGWGIEPQHRYKGKD